MLRARALRCLSAPSSHPSLPPSARCLKHRSYRRANVQQQRSYARCRWRGTARERHVQQGMLPVAPDDPSESANNKREPTLSQLAALLQCVKLFSIMHLHSQFLIPWPSGTSSVNLHGASGAVLSRISVLLHYASVNRTETPETG